MNKKILGQYFTPNLIVDKMLQLRKNNGSVLEPSGGDGAFSKKITCTSIELDEQYKDHHTHTMDFFDYSIDNKFDTIIGNPPYVKHKDIYNATKDKLDYTLFDYRSNLYLFFIEKCIKHLKDNGELIFITPRDFLKATSSIKLNKWMYENGCITDIIDLGDKRVFTDATPNCIIWRYEKGNNTMKTNNGYETYCRNGQILFTKKEHTIPFSSMFSVKVGAVSGYDKAFEHPDGVDFVYSKTHTTGSTKKMLYNTYHPSLVIHKDTLIKRKIKSFNQDNWFQWGRGYHISEEDRIYVNTKTRNKKPFFYSSCKQYDGSVMALFIKDRRVLVDDIETIVDKLNNIDWDELGFVCDGRFIFTQRSLENCILPESCINPI